VKDLRLYVRYAPADRDVMEGLRTDSVMHPGTYRLKVGPRGQHVELRTSQDVVVERVAVGEPLGSRLGLIWQPPASALRPDREVRFTVMDYTTAAIWLAEELRSAMPQRSNFLTVGYVDADPQRAAAVVN